jgi:NAD+ diphosphatase
MRLRNIFEGVPLDRLGHNRKNETWVADQLASPAARVVPVWRASNLISQPSEDSAEGGAEIPVTPITLDLPDAQALAGDSPLVLLGLAGEAPVFAMDISDVESPLDALGLSGQATFADLRELATVLDRDNSALLAYARALTHWHRHNRFCANCGSPTSEAQAGHVRHCTNPDCGIPHFPRTDPAVIMLVTCGESCLLARRTGRNPPTYSTLAGFVEPGESLEEAVAREVMEEVGLAIDHVQYQSSQPWPFPAQLMLGFRAETAEHDCRYLDDEIQDALWFTRDDLRSLFAGGPAGEHGTIHLPRSISIARRLIKEWVEDSSS